MPGVLIMKPDYYARIEENSEWSNWSVIVYSSRRGHKILKKMLFDCEADAVDEVVSLSQFKKGLTCHEFA